MTDLLTADQMRAIEKAAIDSGSVTGLDLMERAGRGVVEAVFEEWPGLATTAHRAVVLCGPGNNGGDGFVVARLLGEWGWDVEVFLYGDPEKLPPDARTNHDRWTALGPVRPWDDAAIGDRLGGQDHDLVVDALFGTGLTRPMPDDTTRTWEGFVPRVFSDAPHDRPKYVAVDIPSGLCSDSGRNLGGALPADLTVSFHRAKVGHYLCPEGPPRGGALWCGKTVTKDIGLGAGAPGDGVRLAHADPDHLRKKLSAHKYAHGHALVLSGPSGRGGAARLAARGALRIGAGLVTMGCPQGAVQENAAHLDAIMLRCFREVTDLIEFLADGRINAVCLGPGLGKGERAQQMVTAVLAAERATVLDADALTVHEDDPASLFYQLHEACVLTPHAGEFRRLFPDIDEKFAAPATKGPAYSKVDAAREAAARAGCTVLFKGPDTVIADASGRCVIASSAYDRAAPWLATAGSGDVLAGFIAGLLARGLPPLSAAGAAASLHTDCALSFGPGLIAEDLPEELPKAFRHMGL